MVYYCDNCGKELDSSNDNFDQESGGHFCNRCFEEIGGDSTLPNSAVPDYDNYEISSSVDPDFDNEKDYNLDIDINDDFDAYEESLDINARRSKKLTEAAGDDCCALIPIAGGARAVATKYSQIIHTPRNKSIYTTCVDMLGQEDVKINAMHNVVAYVHDMQEAAAVMQMIYEMFGVRGSFMVTWKGDGKLYFAPDTDVDKQAVLAYDNKHPELPPVNLSSPKLYLTAE
jgi:hypothetical protein